MSHRSRLWRVLILLAVLFSIRAATWADEGAPEWKSLGTDDGVDLFEKHTPNSSLVAFRGKTRIAAPLSKIVSVLSDVSRRLEWVANAIRADEIEFYSAYKRLEYNETKTPWPLQNRDFVIEAQISVDLPLRAITVSMRSVEDERLPERSGIVRGSIESSAYRLTQVGPNETEVEVEIHADPKGAIPHFLVNTFQRNWPRQTLGSIRRQSEKTDVIPVAHLDEYFNGTAPVALVERALSGDRISTAQASPVHEERVPVGQVQVRESAPSNLRQTSSGRSL